MKRVVTVKVESLNEGLEPRVGSVVTDKLSACSIRKYAQKYICPGLSRYDFWIDEER